MEEQLRSGAEALRLDLSEHQFRQLLDYAALLQKWGRVYNLTSRLAPDEIASQHLLDSLAVVDPLRRMSDTAASRLLDVGSGAGLPGVVLAIALPGLRVDCVDSVAKKAAFVQQAAGTLRLCNLRGIHSRVEDLDGTYAVVTSRAFASLRDFAEITAPRLESGGVWMALKGKFPGEEVAQLPPGVEMFHVEQLQVPGLGAERCLVWLRRAAA